MKKIILISLPTPTFNNTRAASALPYHLIKGAKKNRETEFEIYSFNINSINTDDIKKTEKELDVRIHILSKPNFVKWMFKLHLLFLRVLLKYPLYAYLNINEATRNNIVGKKPDTIWVYGEELARIAKLFSGFNRIVTMPDCESMFYHRLLSRQFAADMLLSTMKYAYAYYQYRRMEHDFCSKDIVYHFVGKADTEFYKGINPDAQAVFLPHPLYAYNDSKEIKFHKPKIKLLFAGRYDFYCRHGSDLLLEAMLEVCDLKDKYEITFLGKGWDTWTIRLKEANWQCNHIVFALDYIKELQKHDIQINAIDVGTGTKGKVLDAISNGLLEIGTPYALENISVENGKSCIIYNSPAEAIKVLQDIPHNIANYEKMATDGKNAVISVHSSRITAQKLFKIGQTE